jgi:hypothetical protein
MEGPLSESDNISSSSGGSLWSRMVHFLGLTTPIAHAIDAIKVTDGPLYVGLTTLRRSSTATLRVTDGPLSGSDNAAWGTT